MPVPSVSSGSLQLGTSNVGNLSHCLAPAKKYVLDHTKFSKKSNRTIQNKNQNDDIKHLSFLSPLGKFVQCLLHYYINLYLFPIISRLIPIRHNSIYIKQF